MNKSLHPNLVMVTTTLTSFLILSTAQASSGYMSMSSGDNKFTATVTLESNPSAVGGISAAPESAYVQDAQFGFSGGRDSKALISVNGVKPESNTSTYREHITLQVNGLASNIGYVPTGLGSIHSSFSWPLDNKWLYGAFTEPKSATSPMLKHAVIVAKYENVRISRPLRIAVWPVFQNLVQEHQHGPDEVDFPASPHLPTDFDYESAWRYAWWKYGINISNVRVSFDRSLSTAGLTNPNLNPMDNRRPCSLGLLAFRSERICAGTLGHENVHGGQSLQMSRNDAEKEAYQWELGHQNILHYDENELGECQDWYNYYNGTGPKPE